MQKDANTRYIQPDIVKRFVVDLFGKYGVGPAEAAMVADNLIDADIRGVTTHGLTRIPLYVEKIEAGLCFPENKPLVVKDMLSTALIDAQHCMGQVSATMAMEMAIEKAKKTGVGFVGVRNACHYGTAGYYAMMAVKDFGNQKLAIAGGVASNSSLRAAMEKACKENGIEFYHPSPVYCTDNAAMIGVAAYYELLKGVEHGWDLNAVPNLKLGER